MPPNQERVPKETRNELLLLGVLQVFAPSGGHLGHSVDRETGVSWCVQEHCVNDEHCTASGTFQTHLINLEAFMWRET